MKKLFTVSVIITGILISVLLSTYGAMGEMIPMMQIKNSSDCPACGRTVINLYLYDSDVESWVTVKDNCLQTHPDMNLNKSGTKMLYAELTCPIENNSWFYVYDISIDYTTEIKHLEIPASFQKEEWDMNAHFDNDDNIIYNDNGILKKMDVSGNYIERIATPQDDYTFSMFWMSPDRLKIIVIEYKTLTGGYDCCNHERLVMYNTDGSGRTVIKPDYNGAWNWLSWKPDSSGFFYYHHIFSNDGSRQPKYFSFDISGGTVIETDLSLSDIGFDGSNEIEENVCLYTRCNELLSITKRKLYDEQGKFIADQSSVFPDIDDARFGYDEIGDIYFSNYGGSNFRKYELMNCNALSCSGFESPMDRGAVKVKKNKVLPFRAKLLNEDGNPVTDAIIGENLPWINVIREAGTISAQDVTDESLSAGHGTDGNEFLFDNVAVNWFYNLKTWNYSSIGKYTVTIESPDENIYIINPPCKASFVIERR